MVTAWWIDFVKIWKIGQKFGRSPDPKTDGLVLIDFFCWKIFKKSRSNIFSEPPEGGLGLKYLF